MDNWHLLLVLISLFQLVMFLVAGCLILRATNINTEVNRTRNELREFEQKIIETIKRRRF